jgi:hypothetical protein
MHSKSPGYTTPSLGRDDGDITTGEASSCLATDRSRSAGKQQTNDGQIDRNGAGDQRWRVGRFCISVRMSTGDRLAPVAVLIVSVGSGMDSPWRSPTQRSAGSWWPCTGKSTQFWRLVPPRSDPSPIRLKITRRLFSGPSDWGGDRLQTILGSRDCDNNACHRVTASSVARDTPLR